MTQQIHPQTAMDLAKLMQRMAGNPKTRARALSLVKEVDPGYRLPADVAIENLKAEQKAERIADQQNHQKALREQRYKTQRAAAVKSHGEDEVKKIETGILKKYPHLEFDDALKLHAADTTVATPKARDRANQFRHGQHWEFPSIPGLLENPDKAATDMAYAVIDELRGAA